MDIQKVVRSLHRAAEITYSRSGGPGGQNVNKVNTKVTLRITLTDLEGLSEAELIRLRQVLSSKITTEDELLIHAEEERSQRTNLERAFSRAEMLIVSAARLPKKRKPTKPSKASKEKRLQTKHLHGIKKSNRHFSSDDF